MTEIPTSPEPAGSVPRSNKVWAASAVAAALAVGGVVGFAVSSPGVSGASRAAATTTTAPANQPGQGEKPGGPGGPGRHGFGFGGAQIEAAAKAIGITTEELRTQLKDGKTIAEVAKSKGVDRQKVIDAMVAAGEKELDEAKARIDEAKKDLPDHVAKVVDGEFKPPAGGPGGPGGKGGPGMGRGMGGKHLEPAAKAIGVSVEDLQKAIRDGKSIAEVAKSKGVSEQAVIDAMVKAATDHIDAAVKDGKMEKARADEIKKGLPDAMKRAVQFKFDPAAWGGPGGPGHGPGGPDAKPPAEGD